MSEAQQFLTYQSEDGALVENLVVRVFEATDRLAGTLDESRCWRDGDAADHGSFSNGGDTETISRD